MNLLEDKLGSKLNTALLIFKKKQGFLAMNQAAQNVLGIDLNLLNSQDHVATNLNAFYKIIDKLEAGNYDEELLGSSRHFRREVKIDAQYFNLYIANLEEQDSFLIELSQIVYQDMNQSTHELKRPIQNIKTLVETLMLGAKDDQAKLDEYLSKLNFEADRLGAIVSDMLSLSHLINGSAELNKVEINLAATADKLLELANQRAKAKNIELINQVDKDITVLADKKLLEHLMSNFIDNAIKYNKDPGKVIIKNIDSAFVIEDTGLGIADEDKTKLFEQFYRIQDRVHIQGSGLGLSIVKAIADLHGWHINIESELGQGTSFIIKNT